jgi:integrase
MSNSTILRVIERVGYKGRMTGHGFRSVASTTLNESGLFDFDAIERQLSHEDRNDVRAAYNRAKYMDERRKMMQWWTDTVERWEGHVKAPAS